MKTLSMLGLLIFLAALPLSAIACPAGTHPVGGSGSHHKGGTCK